MISLTTLVVVFLGISLRQLFRIPLRIWQIMSLGAAVVLLTGQISLVRAFEAVDWDIIFFLAGMFYVGQATEESGLLEKFALNKMSKGLSANKLSAMIVFGMGFASALFLNDTLAIIGTPIIILLSRRYHLPLQPLLLALAFAITIGSVTSPIGNPQNLFIALEVPIEKPFYTFLRYLFVPTLINLVVLFFALKWGLRNVAFRPYEKVEVEHYHKGLAFWCKVAISLIFIGIGINLATSYFIPLTYIAVVPAIILLLAAPKRRAILKTVDWHTIIFFIGMFILMQSAWDSGVFEDLVAKSGEYTSIPSILLISVALSQLISNVPLVALYLPTLISNNHATIDYMALAAGSTIAGNLLIFGAASNLIIIQNAEKRGEPSLPFFTFFKYGAPLTALNLLIYYLCL